MTTLLTVLALIALLLAIHPYITFPLSLGLLSALGVRGERTDGPRAEFPLVDEKGIARPTVAVLLCVHNEEAVIEQRMENLLELASVVPGTEVLVYTDGSTDGTVERLQRFGDRIKLVVSPERHGKTHGMNLLVTHTNARFVVFTDAAVRMTADALPNMVRHFDDPRVGCVCGRIIAVNNADESTATADTSIRYWAFDATIRRLETRVASVMGAHGPLFAIRRDVHEPAPVEVFDDFYVSMAILYQGFRVVQAEDFCGYKAVATRREDEYRRKIRIACQSFNIHKIMRPRLRQEGLLVRYLYASHKTLRWLTIFSLSAAAIFGSMALVSAGYWLMVLLAWVIFLACVGLGRAGVKPFTAGYEALGALWANGVGVIQSLRGTNYQTWAPAKSARTAQ